MSIPHRRQNAVRALIAAVLMVSATAGCARPHPPYKTPETMSLLYVVNSEDRTVTRVDALSGRLVGKPIPTGPTPRQVVPGANGALLTLGLRGDLSYSSPTSRAGTERHASQWKVRPLPLDMDGRATHLASDGRHAAVVGYWTQQRTANTPPCFLALVELEQGTIEESHALCRPYEVLVDLAFEQRPEGPIAYAAFWLKPHDISNRPVPDAGRVVALNAKTGEVLASRAMEGVPAQLVLAATPERLGRRLNLLEAIPDFLEEDLYLESPAQEYASASLWVLHSLEPESLHTTSEHLLPKRLRRLSITPDGARAYGLAGDEDSLRQTTVLQADLSDHAGQLGAVPQQVTSLPGLMPCLIATEERVYLSSPGDNRLWVLDRRRGAVLTSISTGRGPTGLTLSSSFGSVPLTVAPAP